MHILTTRLNIKVQNMIMAVTVDDKNDAVNPTHTCE